MISVDIYKLEIYYVVNLLLTPCHECTAWPYRSTEKYTDSLYRTHSKPFLRYLIYKGEAIFYHNKAKIFLRNLIILSTKVLVKVWEYRPTADIDLGIFTIMKTFAELVTHATRSKQVVELTLW